MVSKADIVNTLTENKKLNIPHKRAKESLEIAKCSDKCFYDLYDKYEGKPVKIFQTKDKLLWIVMEDDKYGK